MGGALWIFAIAALGLGIGYASHQTTRHIMLSEVCEACRKVTEVQRRTLRKNDEASAGASWALAEMYAQLDQAPSFLPKTRARLNISARDIDGGAS